jgi:hypothetical protein
VGIVTIKRHLPDMTKRTTCASRGRGDSSAVWVLVFALVLLATTTSAIDLGGADVSGAFSKTTDLTGLSLHELYDLDIVQPNVLGGHTHTAGQIMVGYEYMHTHMAGLYQGSGQVSPTTVFAEGFSTVHTSMDMDMHMFDVMCAPTERLTLMAMLPYKQMSMEHLRSDHTTFVQNADGVGDLEAMGLITILGNIHSGERLILNLGVSFPTGSINVHDHAGGNPNNPEVLLEYLMQLGSGTYDFLPGLTYLGESGSWAWGAQTIETVRFDRNDHGYRFGNEYRVSGWAAYGVTDWFAPSVRLDGRWWDEITGDDPGLANNPTPEGRTDLHGGRRIDLLLGLNFCVPKGFLKGNRLAVEGGFPIYQYLNGPQLGIAWMINVGWTYAF